VAVLTINFQPFPELTSDRLCLRRITVNDAPVILALHSDADVMQCIPLPLFTTMQHALDHIGKMDTKMAVNEWINWAITLKGDTQMIGLAGLYRIQAQHHRCQVGYMLLPAYAGKGISTEATGLMLEFAFKQLHMHSVEALIYPGNTASERVLQKNGFVKEGHLTENVLHNGVFSDSIIYSLLRRNWESREDI
jgi:ribosomal-protein-alanine N-acetyltransferase